MVLALTFNAQSFKSLSLRADPRLYYKFLYFPHPVGRNDYGLFFFVIFRCEEIASLMEEEGERGPDEGYLLVRVHVPELNVQKCLQFPRDQLVWDVKQQCLAALPKVSINNYPRVPLRNLLTVPVVVLGRPSPSSSSSLSLDVTRECR